MAKLKENQQTLTQGDLRGSNTMMQLLSYVERYERLTEEIDGITGDRKEVMAEAKGLGFDTTVLRKVIARRKMDSASRMEADAILETYEEAIRQAEKNQIKESQEAAEPPAPKPETPAPAKAGFSFKKKPAPAQMDVEELAPSDNDVQAEAAKQIGRAADKPDDEIPSFLRRAK